MRALCSGTVRSCQRVHHRSIMHVVLRASLLGTSCLQPGCPPPPPAAAAVIVAIVGGFVWMRRRRHRARMVAAQHKALEMGHPHLHLHPHLPPGSALGHGGGSGTPSSGAIYAHRSGLGLDAAERGDVHPSKQVRAPLAAAARCCSLATCRRNARAACCRYQPAACDAACCSRALRCRPQLQPRPHPRRRANHSSGCNAGAGARLGPGCCGGRLVAAVPVAAAVQRRRSRQPPAI